MATNNTESIWQKGVEFFTQNKEDRTYEGEGGDDRVPKEDRKGDPRKEARIYARDHGEDDPYPEDGPLDQPGTATSA